MVNKDWLDVEILTDYLDGKLDARTMNKVEREALEDPFVAEALAGLSRSPKRSADSLSLLQRQLQERISEQQNSKKTSVITWQRLSIASTAAVLFIAVGIAFWMRQNNYRDAQANQEKRVEVSISPKKAPGKLVRPEEQLAASKPAEPLDKTAVNANVISTAVDDKHSPELAEARQNSTAASITVAVADDGPVAARVADSAVLAAANISQEVLAKTDSLTAEEPVIRGYQARTKSAVRGNALTAPGRGIADVPVANIEQILQGKVSGLNIRGVAQPGINQLKTYLIKENRFSAGIAAGSSATFQITLKNRRPVNVQVVHGLSKQYDLEAVRLIRNWTKWTDVPDSVPFTVVINY